MSRRAPVETALLNNPWFLQQTLAADFVRYDRYKILRVTGVQPWLRCRVRASHPEGYPYRFQYIDNESDAKMIASLPHFNIDMRAVSSSDVDGAGADGQSNFHAAYLFAPQVRDLGSIRRVLVIEVFELGFY